MLFISVTSHGCHPALHSFPTRRSSDLLPGLFRRNVARGAPREERLLHARHLLGLLLTHRPTEQVGLREGESGERSEEHTSELQSPCNLVCRLLLEKITYVKELTKTSLM